MSKSANPQGKAHLPALATLSSLRAPAAGVPPKPVEQVSAELFTSLFVLESHFEFKPVAGRSYWLYRKAQRFWLSVISPREWSAGVSGDFVGRCELQADMTWTLELSEAMTRDAEFMRLLEDRRRCLQRRLEEVSSLEQILPFHEARLGFYRRAFAFALAHSLGASMDRAGILELSYRQARGLLEHPRRGESAPGSG